MSFLGIIGMNLAMNLVNQLLTPKPPRVDMSYMNNMSRVMENHSKEMQTMWEQTASNKTFSMDFKTPDFPEAACNKFEQMQQNNQAERMAFMSKFQGEKEEMKSDFFSKNHYETKADESGKEQVVLRDGKPVLAEGKESANQKVARQNFENSQKSEMFARHGGEKQEFVQNQKQQLTTFMDANKFQLSNPTVQGEMAKLIADSQKKALKLQQDHEEEYYKIDLPVKEMEGVIDERLAEYRQMEERQTEAEYNSPEAAQLANYQQDLVSLLDSKRAEARETRKSEMFLQDLRKVMQNPPRADLVTVLPMNMVAALENFGIEQIPS